MILIDSVYINSGGGKVLLEYIISKLVEKQFDNFFILLDKRLEFSSINRIEKIKHKFIKPSEYSRRKFYLKHKDLFISFFCFSNIPPPISISNKKVSIYFHNTLLINYNEIDLSLFEKFKFFLKKKYLMYLNRSNYIWISQSEEIKKLIQNKFAVCIEKVKIFPVFNIDLIKDCNKNLDINNNNYLYVADSSKHKNHKNLLSAWELFAKNNKKVFSLNLTIPENESNKNLLLRINRLVNNGYKIINHKNCNHSEIMNLYERCNYVIFPSLTESFGLPLVEAASAGCKIICADPYVYQVIKPSLVFNPIDVNSILNSLNLSKNYHKVDKSELIIKMKLIN